MAENKMELEEFEFPDEVKAKPDTESNEEFEIEIENDVPPQDRNRKAVNPEVVEALEEEDLEKFNNDQNTALKEAKKVYHQERREKEAAIREQQEAINLAKKALAENKMLKERLHTVNLCMLIQ
jgi:hypothetical protein